MPLVQPESSQISQARREKRKVESGALLSATDGADERRAQPELLSENRAEARPRSGIGTILERRTENASRLYGA